MTVRRGGARRIITDDRGRRGKALFEGAVERPSAERAAYLFSEAAGDEELRREVESLLAFDGSDRVPVERLTHAMAGALNGVTADDRPVYGAGDHLGSYDVVGLLGVGAMGEVYRARDTKLHRDVALKVLPESVANDPDRRARFTREAHILASLNHPNIAAIYGFEDSDDRHALVLELVEGPTLADCIVRGPLVLSDVLSIARQ